MKLKLFMLLLLLYSVTMSGQPEILSYHEIKTDGSGKILPWFSSDPGTSYSYIIQLVWHFWDTMRIDMNGIPYYMNHQVWKDGADDTRGIGGDQLQMALSSWLLLYQYTGNEKIKENMKFMAGYYISHGFSDSSDKWPGIPYPYNTLIYSGLFDGDMVIGKNYTQPDKAGSMGLELIHLYKMTGTKRHGQTPSGRYLDAAVGIANTLAAHITPGDEKKSPLPFKVNAVTGEAGRLINDSGAETASDYTTNWTGTMELFLELIKMNKGDVALYRQSFDILLSWMKDYPLKNNKWGPFFEDVPGWSDTQINAVTFAQFIMNHREYFPNWINDVEGIFSWVYNTLGNKTWEKYGVVVVNEQTSYKTPGNSHTARQGSAELQYVSLTGDTMRKQNAIRQMNWATYMVDYDGKNCFPSDEIWLTDGYGDYVRHFLRTMGDIPELAPGDEDHILYSSSVVQEVNYKYPAENKYRTAPSNHNKNNIRVSYVTYDKTGLEKIRLSNKPSGVSLNNLKLNESVGTGIEGYHWLPYKSGGLLIVNRLNGNEVTIFD